MDILRTEFVQLIIDDQDCFAKEEQCEILLEILGNKEVTSKMRKKWNSCSRSSTDKWKDLKREVLATPVSD